MKKNSSDWLEKNISANLTIFLESGIFIWIAKLYVYSDYHLTECPKNWNGGWLTGNFAF